MTVPAPPTSEHAPVPPVLRHAGELLIRYDVIFCDVWGVLHDGFKAYDSAGAALVRFRGQGGTVILVSNAPVPRHRVQAMLDLRGVSRAAYDDIVSSGEIALSHIAAQNYHHVHYIGPRDRDAAFFDKARAKPSELQDAEAIVCTGLNDDRSETETTYTPVLRAALERGLPFVCANPDLVVDVGGRLYLCAGALADVYESMGGSVYWAGKPYPAAYEFALAAAEQARGGLIDKARILAIGDAVRTDLAGAEAAGLDALFITTGIHRAETMESGVIVADKLAQLFVPGGPKALAAMPTLAW